MRPICTAPQGAQPPFTLGPHPRAAVGLESHLVCVRLVGRLVEGGHARTVDLHACGALHEQAPARRCLNARARTAAAAGVRLTRTWTLCLLSISCHRLGKVSVCLCDLPEACQGLAHALHMLSMSALEVRSMLRTPGSASRTSAGQVSGPARPLTCISRPLALRRPCRLRRSVRARGR